MKKLSLSLSILAFFSFTQLSFAAAPFGVSPKEPDLVESQNIHLELKPGQEKTEYITAKNNSNEELLLEIYPVDGIFKDGTIDGFTLYTTPQNEVGVWTKIEENELTLAPNSQKDLKVTINIPTGQTLGDYVGGIGYQRKNTSVVENGIKLNYRFIIGLKIKVTDDPQPIAKRPLPPDNTYLHYYFWGSLGLFVIVITSFIVNKIRSKRHKVAKKS